MPQCADVRASYRYCPPDGSTRWGATAFAAGTADLAIASADQAVQNGNSSVGFPLNGALVALPP